MATALNPLALYTHMLPSFGLVADEQGLVSTKIGDDLMPVSVNDLRLVLPTPEIMKASQWRVQQAFHPIGESVIRGESPVIRKLKQTALERLTHVFIEALVTIVKFAADSSKHAGLTPEQIAVFQCIPDADKKFANAVGKVIQAMEPVGPHAVFEIYLKRNPKLHGESFHRGAMISFPIVKELTAPGNKVYGVDMGSARNKSALLALVTTLIPNCNVPDVYSYCSSSSTAPYFDALVHGFVGVLKPMNMLAWLFRTHPGLGEMYTDLDWIDNMKDLNLYRDIIPMLDGNEGDLLDAAAPVGTAAVAVPPEYVVAAPVKPVAPAPAGYAPAYAAAPSTGNATTDWLNFTASKAMGGMGAPVFATVAGGRTGVQQPMQQGYGYPTASYAPAVPTFAAVGAGYQQPQPAMYGQPQQPYGYPSMPMQPVFI